MLSLPGKALGNSLSQSVLSDHRQDPASRLMEPRWEERALCLLQSVGGEFLNAVGQGEAGSALQNKFYVS